MTKKRIGNVAASVRCEIASGRSCWRQVVKVSLPEGQATVSLAAVTRSAPNLTRSHRPLESAP